MAYSIQTAVSDGTLEVLDLSIKYMDKSHIFVYVDDVLVDGSAYSYVWLTDTRIQVVPAIANGSTIKVIRKTLTDEMWHEFSKGARFSTTSMDENFEQLLFLAQEYSEGIYVSDFYSDVDLHLKRILNLRDPINDRDAVNLKTLKEYLPNANLLPSIIDQINTKVSQTALASSTGAGLVGVNGGYVSDRLKAVVTPREFPATSTHLSIIAALNHLHLLGGGVLRLTEDVTLTSKIVGAWSNVTIDLNGHTITWAGAGADSLYQGVIQNVGTLTTTVGTVASDSAAYSNAVTLADASAFAVGDVILIDSASTVSPGVYLNILARVVSKLGNTLFTDVYSRIPITASEGVTVTKVNPVRNFWVKNGKMVATGQTSRANGMGAVYVAYCVDSGVDKFKSEGFWFKGMKTTFCNNISCYDVEVSKPAAVGGGEGYGIQFEYSYNCNAYRLRGLALRHLIDHTAAFGCEVYDGLSIGSTDAAYNLHSSYEYDIGYTNCRSFGSATNDFALGGTGTGFADYTDKIRLNSCLGKGSLGDSIKFASRGKGLEINGGEFNPSQSTVAYSLVTSMSDVTGDRVDLTGGLQVAMGGTLPTDGKVRFDNSRLVKQPNSRSLLLAAGAVVQLNDSDVYGQMTLGVNAKVKWTGGVWYSQNSSDELVTNTPAGAINGQEISLTGVKISTSAIYKAAGYTLLAAKLDFNSVEFDTGPHVTYLYGAKTTLSAGCYGVLRAYVSGAYVSDLAVLNPRLSGQSDGARVLQVAGFTGRITLNGGTIDANARTNTAIDLSDVGNTIAALTVTNLQITGTMSIPDARVTRCNITGVVGNGNTSVLPTASATKIVTNNVFY